jgi:hypothetical protein
VGFAFISSTFGASFSLAFCSFFFVGFVGGNRHKSARHTINQYSHFDVLAAFAGTLKRRVFFSAPSTYWVFGLAG